MSGEAGPPPSQAPGESRVGPAPGRTPLWSCALPVPTLPTERVRAAIGRIWRTVEADRRNAGPRMAEGLRAERGLGSKERPVAGDVLKALIRHHRALEYIERAQAEGRAERPAWCPPGLLGTWYSLAELGVPDLPDPAEGADRAESAESAGYAIAVSMPDAIAAEWWARLAGRVGRAGEVGAGEVGPAAEVGAIALARTLAGRAPLALRVLREGFTLSVPVRRVGARAILVEGRVNLDAEPAYRDGYVEVQDLGSQAIVDEAWRGLQPGARVLDLCAGAGGKSLSLAALGAEVQAWDIRPRALQELEQRARRARLPVRIAPPPRPGPGHRYDLVLVDAPCSGSGVLRRHPENRWRLEFPTTAQRALLEQALALAPRVVYATCSLVRRENEALVRSVAEPSAEATLWPEPDGQEGFYWARFGG